MKDIEHNSLGMDKKKVMSLLLGPFLFGVLVFFGDSVSLSGDMGLVVAMAVWMVVWWMFESVPIAITALLPMVILPLGQISSTTETMAPYASPIIFLFMGGFMLALGLEKHNLHQRIALFLIRIIGTKANSIILGFMVATAGLSMWISNTATAVMMLPIAMSVVNMVGGKSVHIRNYRYFRISLFLSVAYAANIGGLATVIGTPPNVVLVGLSADILGIEISFVEWMKMAIPIVVLMLFMVFILLTRLLFPNRLGRLDHAKESIDAAYHALGKWTLAQKQVALIFIVTALGWVFKPQINQLLREPVMDDAVTAMIGGIAMFVVPTRSESQWRPILPWEVMKNLPWHIILLFGGGMSLAKALEKVGLIDRIGTMMAANNLWPYWGLLAVMLLLVLFATELMSNVALVTIMLPMVFGMAQGLDMVPLHLGIPLAMASSCAFMMPISTPPNAIVFSSGYIRMRDMMKAGIFLNLIAILFLTLAGMTLVKWFF